MIKPDKPARPDPIYFILLFVPLFWGGAFGVTKHVVAEIPPLTTAAVRFFLAGLLMTAWVAARGEWDWAPLKRRWGGVLLLALTGVFLYNIFFTVGMKYTSAINGALVIVVNPVTTAIVAVTLLGEPWSWRLVAGVALAFLGVLTTITRGSVETLAALSFSGGDLLMVGGVISWTAYTTIGKVVMKDVPPLLATSASTLAGSVLLLAATLAEDGWARLPAVSAQVAWEMVYLIVFPTVVAFFLYNVGIKRIGASRASAYINLMPVNAIWIAAVFYGETVTLAHLAGAALIISGLLLITVFDIRPSAAGHPLRQEE
ncbi:DMT family transporter [Anaeroselena agilis]|uniref:DMT family transporter n=1 Tax=Anaeroselena agilis TaxID=3063788 RepID=A0ABU3NZK1_9FIRM|nr:DMT family transporter [Selenomonadales bacterium 4137-cl]